MAAPSRTPCTRGMRVLHETSPSEMWGVQDCDFLERVSFRKPSGLLRATMILPGAALRMTWRHFRSLAGIAGAVNLQLFKEVSHKYVLFDRKMD